MKYQGVSILDDVLREYERGDAKHGQYHSIHEGYAVIKEELDELWDEIKKQEPSGEHMYEEAIQVAASAVKFAKRLGEKAVAHAETVSNTTLPSWSNSLHHRNGTFKLGASVQKKNGYGFIGKVRTIFLKEDHQVRLVVEATKRPYQGMLHIYSPDELLVVHDVD